jgi:hypothetical protein
MVELLGIIDPLNPVASGVHTGFVTVKEIGESAEFKEYQEFLIKMKVLGANKTI